MHDAEAEGNDFFKCDYCLSPWAEDRPMVEGHKGSLICAKCLSMAYAQVIHARQGHGPREGVRCTLCLMTKEQLHWESPLSDEGIACEECIRRSARMLAKDPDYEWEPPPAPDQA